MQDWVMTDEESIAVRAMSIGEAKIYLVDFMAIIHSSLIIQTNVIYRNARTHYVTGYAELYPHPQPTHTLTH